MIKPVNDLLRLPYKRKLSYNRDMVIYAVCEHDSGRHYCINRRYLVLPVQLPDVALRAIKESCTSKRGVTCGHGAMLEYLAPKALLADAECWTAYAVFKDGSAPKWDKNTDCIRLFLEGALYA